MVAFDYLHLVVCGLDQEAAIVVELLADIICFPDFDSQLVIAFVLGSNEGFVKGTLLLPLSLCCP